MKIYVEVIILDNLIIDYIILRICGMKERVEYGFWRLFFASILGVIIAFVSLVDMNGFLMLVLKIIASLAMVFIAFGREKFLRLLFDFYFFTFAIGGCAMGILYLKEGVSFGVFQGVASLPTGVIFGAVFLGYKISKRIIYIFSGKAVKDSYRFVVEVKVGCKTDVFEGFLDSGNMLIFGDDLRGVCVGEYRHFLGLFKGEKQWGHVATKTVTSVEFLSVYKASEVAIYESVQGGKEKRVVAVQKDFPIALSKEAISEDFEILLPPMMFY